MDLRFSFLRAQSRRAVAFAQQLLGAWRAETVLLRADRLNQELTPERRMRYTTIIALAFLLGAWLPPGTLEHLVAKVVLGGIFALVALVATRIAERERQEHARLAKDIHIEMPPGVTQAEEYFIRPALAVTDARIDHLARRHPVTLVPRILAILVLLMVCGLVVFNSVGNLKFQVVLCAVSWSTGQLLYITWHRRFLIVTEDRFIDVQDLPPPLDDDSKSSPLPALTQIEFSKPWWAQLLPGQPIAGRITMMMQGTKYVSPFIVHGAEFKQAIHTAQARDRGKGE